MAHGAYALGVELGILRIDRDDHLEPCLALGDELFRDFDQLFLGILFETEGDVSLHRILRAAEQTPDRFFIVLAFDIPERDVDGAHGGAPHAGLGARVELLIKLIPDALSLERILPAQERGQLTIDEFAHAEPLRAAREAVACYAEIGFDGGKQNRRDNLFFQQRHIDRHAMQRRFDIRNFQKPPPGCWR